MERQKCYASAELARMLKEAMAAERMAIRNYDLLLEAAQEEDVREDIRHIRREEKRHYVLLEGMYEEMTGLEYAVGRAPASMPQNYYDMIRTSICDELEAVNFYEYLAKEIDCEIQRATVWEIMNEEKEHARILAAIYRRA